MMLLHRCCFGPGTAWEPRSSNRTSDPFAERLLLASGLEPGFGLACRRGGIRLVRSLLEEQVRALFEDVALGPYEAPPVLEDLPVGLARS